MSRFVRPETTVLTISHGDTLTVKTRLSSGEQREAYARMYLPGADGLLHVNHLQSGLAMMVAYIVDWTLTDDAGVVVPVRGLSVGELEAILNTLDPESFAEIKGAIETHEETQRSARAEEKKVPAGSNGAEATSPSPSASAGASSGSVN